MVFLSGDKKVCEEAKMLNPEIMTLPVKEGISGSVTSIHPALAVRKIGEGVLTTLSKRPELFRIKLPEAFEVELEYRDHPRAYKCSFYPGMEKKDDFTLIYRTGDFFDVLRMFLFAGY